MITFGSGVSVVDCSWAEFKAFVTSKAMVIQCDTIDEKYTIFAFDGSVLAYVTTIWRGTIPNLVGGSLTQGGNDADLAAFEASYLPYVNRSLVLKDNRGAPQLVATKPDTPKVTLYSHDWCDKTTWYEQATRVVNETTTPSGILHLVFNLAHNAVIDTYHGKITQEDTLLDASGNSYRVVVTDDNVLRTERDPHLGSGGDYTINYDTGVITFFTARSPSAVIRATYHYASGSRFTLKPSTGKILSVEFVECQFSDNIEIRDSVKFQAYGWVISFAPQLAQSNGGIYPDHTLIPLGAPLTYKGMRDFVNDAVRSYVQYPALGNTNWRGLARPIYVFDWDYARSTGVRSSMGMEIRVYLEHDIVFGGEMATATFYCSSENE